MMKENGSPGFLCLDISVALLPVELKSSLLRGIFVYFSLLYALNASALADVDTTSAFPQLPSVTELNHA